MSVGRRPRTFDLFIGSLPLDAKEDELRTIFEEFGDISSVTIRENQKRNDGSALAFVRFLNEADADIAAARRKQHDFRGHILHVIRTEKKPLGTSNMTNNSSNWDNRNGTKSSTTWSNVGGGGSGYGDACDKNVTFSGSLLPTTPDLVADQSLKINDWQPMPISFEKHYSDNNLLSQSHPAPNHAPPTAARIDMLDKLKKPRREHVMITHVETPAVFWGQVMSTTTAECLIQLGRDLTNISQCFQAISGKPDFSKVYGAVFSDDGMWYRCQPISFLSDEKTLFRYIDYGNTEIVSNGAVMELPANVANIKPYCKKYALRSIEPLESDEQSENYSKAKDLFSRITDSQLLDCEVHLKDENDCSWCELYVDGHNLTHDLIKSGLFMKNHQKNLRGPRNVTSPTQQLNQSNHSPTSLPLLSVATTHNAMTAIPSVYQQSNFHQQYPPEFIQQTQELLLERQQLLKQKNINKQQSERLNQLKLQNDGLLRDLTKTSDDLQNAYGERDNAVLEMATSKGRIKILQGELEGKNISTKLKILMSGVSSIRMIRRQFPTDDQTLDLVNTAILLVTDNKNKITSDTDLVRRVKEALTNYENNQKMIRDCQDTEALDCLIQQRDESRMLFFDSLTNFLKTMKEMPLDHRVYKLKESVHALSETYSFYIAQDIHSQACLEEIIEKYLQWRAQKMTVFSKARTITNTHHNIVSNAFRTIQQDLSLDLSTPTSINTNIDLDKLLTTFQDCIRNELNVSCLGSEASIVGETVQVLMMELKVEIAHIEHLIALRNEFIHLKESLQHWLYEKPDVSPLQSIRKTYKSLRSKLGHLLVDKNDLDESDEDLDELERVERELCDIRKKLHETFKQEDKLLDELADVSRNHFPELQIKHPELGIVTYVQYGGLLKQSLDIDQFNTLPFPGCDKKSVYVSTFDGEPVFIKEYLIAETVGVTKDFFLSQAVQYNGIKHENIADIWAIFLHKNGQQAYTLSRLRTSLMSKVNSLNGQDIHTVLCSVLKGLEAFHSQMSVYGALHLDNILINEEDNSVCLADYDLTKTPEQRAALGKAGPGGLLYSSPEAVSQSEASTATDVFSFGILMLQLLKPVSELNIRHDGRPEQVQYKTGPCEIVQHLLKLAPQSRPPVSQILAYSYFSHPYQPIEETLQLRAPSPTEGKRVPGSGILKNGSPNVSLSCDDDVLASMPELEDPSPESIALPSSSDEDISKDEDNEMPPLIDEYVAAAGVTPDVIPNIDVECDNDLDADDEALVQCTELEANNEDITPSEILLPTSEDGIISKESEILSTYEHTDETENEDTYIVPDETENEDTYISELRDGN